MRGRTIHMKLVPGALNKASGKLTQYDKGQIIQFDGVDLPYSYTVYFSNCPNRTSKPWLGLNNQVEIPDEYGNIKRYISKSYRYEDVKSDHYNTIIPAGKKIYIS